MKGYFCPLCDEFRYEKKSIKYHISRDHTVNEMVKHIMKNVDRCKYDESSGDVTYGNITYVGLKKKC